LLRAIVFVRLSTILLGELEDGAWEYPRLALEPGEPLGISGEAARQDFDRDLASQFGVPRAIDLL
jgi:hypothetical protein